MDGAGQIIDPNKSDETLAEVVEEVEEEHADFQAAYDAGGHFKEQLEAISKSWTRTSPEAPLGAREHEIKEMEEIPENPEIVAQTQNKELFYACIKKPFLHEEVRTIARRTLASRLEDV